MSFAKAGAAREKSLKSEAPVFDIEMWSINGMRCQ
jgi:hypothetical protein